MYKRKKISHLLHTRVVAGKRWSRQVSSLFSNGMRNMKFQVYALNIFFPETNRLWSHVFLFLFWVAKQQTITCLEKGSYQNAPCTCQIETFTSYFKKKTLTSVMGVRVCIPNLKCWVSLTRHALLEITIFSFLRRDQRYCTNVFQHTC